MDPSLKHFLKNTNYILVLLFIISNSGCATTGLFRNRYAAADKIAAAEGFNKIFIKTDNFVITSYSRIKKPGEPVTIYIEGDGAAWQTKTRLSNDPTTRNPMVLRLAAIDNYPNIIYLARPGQYSKKKYPLCDPAYWSDERFSEEVIESMNQAINQSLKSAKSEKIHLIGYSGGAAVAILVAAKRQDVLSIRTIAGNLDSEEVNKHHGVSRMKKSLNPINAALLIKDIPQCHFVGEKDNIIPIYIAERFFEAAGSPENIKIIVIKGATHTKGWDKKWEELLMVKIKDG